MMVKQELGPSLTHMARRHWAGVGNMGNPAGHMSVAPPSRHGCSQGWGVLTGVRVDVPEPGGEESPDEEGAEGDAQDSSQPQPTVCGRTRPSVSPRFVGASPLHLHSHPSPLPCPQLTVAQSPVILHRHLQDLLKDGVVLWGRSG